MKKLLILATMLFSFSFANAQSKIYSASSGGYKDRVVGIFENGKIYSASSGGYKDRVVGIIEGDKIYSASSGGYKDRVVGVFEGGYATGAAGAFLFLL